MKNNDKSVISPLSENTYHSDGCLKLKASSIFYMYGKQRRGGSVNRKVWFGPNRKTVNFTSCGSETQAEMEKEDLTYLMPWT